MKNAEVLRKPKNESAEHLALKKVARQFLEELGCININEEYRFNNSVVDILGNKGKQLMAVECGGSVKSKLVKLREKVDKIYILPYGQDIPYLWQQDFRICSACGNSLGKKRTDHNNNLLTIDETAAILRLHRETVKWYVQIGKLKAVKLGYRTVRVKPEDLQKFIESRSGDKYFE